MEKAQFGHLGLGTMGRNLMLNVAEQGFSSAGYDIDETKREMLVSEGAGLPVEVVGNIPDFVSRLSTPRSVMVLVPAGPIVDSVIGNLVDRLEPGDIVVDGGNSHFTDTERRHTTLAEKGIAFLGVGVSGGEEGARHGASIMAGGDPVAYERVRPIFEAASAKVDGEPCAARVGNGSAGHFVKMVHNGIEYGMMQLIAETYDYMKRVLGMDAAAMSDTFAEWNKGELNSFLIEITATVLRKTDAETGKPLVEMILDTAGQKGTGKWTSLAAMDLGVPVPTIDAAVAMRQISAKRDTRASLAALLGSAPYAEGIVAKTNRMVAVERHVVHITQLRDALLCGFVITYAQGMSLLRAASAERSYGLNLADIAKIWRGGCIIRSRLLEYIRSAFATNGDLPSLLLDARIAEILATDNHAFRKTLGAFVGSGVPAMCFSSAMAYFDALRTERLPANLIQAQRDLFGAHTYQRLDKEGTFHTDWHQNREQ